MKKTCFVNEPISFLATLTLTSNDVRPDQARYFYDLSELSCDWMIVTGPTRGPFEYVADIDRDVWKTPRLTALLTLAPNRVGLTTFPVPRIYWEHLNDSSSVSSSLTSVPLDQLIVLSSMRMIQVLPR
jgi:hypothetical protein